MHYINSNYNQLNQTKNASFKRRDLGHELRMDFTEVNQQINFSTTRHAAGCNFTHSNTGNCKLLIIVMNLQK